MLLWPVWGGGLKFHFSSRLSPGRNPDPVVQLGQIAGILWYWQFILPRVWILLPIRRLWAEHCITCNCYLGGKARENSENPASRRERRSLGRNAAASLWEFSYTTVRSIPLHLPRLDPGMGLGYWCWQENMEANSSHQLQPSIHTE